MGFDDVGEDFRVVGEGHCEPDVANANLLVRLAVSGLRKGHTPVSSSLLQLIGKVLVACLAHSITHSLNSHELVEPSGCLIPSSILIRCNYDNILQVRKVAPEYDARAIRVVCHIVHPRRIRINVRLGLVLRVHSDATPEVALRKRLHIEARYDAEVRGATFERKEEVGVGCGVCVYDFAACEDNFEVLNLVAGEAALGCEEGVASSGTENVGYNFNLMCQSYSQEPGDTDCARSSTCNSDAVLFKLCVYHSPSVSRLELRKIVYLVVRCGVHETHIKRHSIVDVVGTGPGGVTSTSYSKVAVGS